MKILIIGHARHGKDTTAEFINEQFGYTFESSSLAASRIFLYEALRTKYGYVHPKQCFDDRVNHRAEWHDLICEYNKDDKARLAKEILSTSNMYVGMRSDEEAQECLRQGIFDLVIGVYNPHKPLEPSTSFNIDLWKTSDIIIPNAGSREDLYRKVSVLENLLIKKESYELYRGEHQR